MDKTEKKHKVKKPFFRRTGIRILLGLIVVLIALRIALPYIALKYANKALANMHGYYGHVNDIDIALYRGAYKINNIYLHKVDTLTQEETEFFEAGQIDLSVEWQALLDGKIVGELEFRDPRLRFTKDKAEPDDVKKDTTDFRKLLDGFMPLRVNRFEIISGVIQYIDAGSTPKVDIQLDNAHILAENLTSEKDTSLLPATVAADANIYQGHLDLHMRLDPLAKEPTFDMNTELKDTHLPDLNEFFKAYAKLDVNKGTFGLYAEVAAKQGNFIGYVKPVIKDLDVLGPEDRNDNILRKMWEAIAGGVGQLLTNPKHDQVATKIPLKGSFKNSKANLWYAVVEVLRNAFIEALHPSIDQEINIGSVGSDQEKSKGLFGKRDEKKDDKKDDKKEEPKTEKKEKKGLLNKLFKKDKKKEEDK
ncbi:MAG: hypothetical protein JWO09_2224 [Bacteroidetes bacterium]|nr:hypothetical protein [Bacteroidota bacterium]